MTTYSNNLRLALQETGENDGTWGDVANNGVFELLEDAIAGLAEVSLSSGSVTLSSNDGSSDQARCMIIKLTGSLGSSRTLTIPAVSKVYLMWNATTGGQTITVTTGSGVTYDLPDDSAVWIYTDGTDVYEIEAAAAVNAATADSADDADALGGVAAANYARLDVGGSTQQFSAAQSTERVTLTAGSSVNVNAALSNCFRLTANQNFTLENPSGGVDGQTIRIIIEQDGTGSRSITWGSKYAFAGGTAAILTTDANAVDYFSFEYDQDNDQWIGGGLLDVS